MPINKELNEFRAKVRTLVADHFYSEGCGCCRDDAEHTRTSNELGKLLKTPKYKDGSGYDFSKFRSKKD